VWANGLKKVKKCPQPTFFWANEEFFTKENIKFATLLLYANIFLLKISTLKTDSNYSTRRAKHQTKL
jgi:hypothetical protein